MFEKNLGEIDSTLHYKVFFFKIFFGRKEARDFISCRCGDKETASITAFFIAVTAPADVQLSIVPGEKSDIIIWKDCILI